MLWGRILALGVLIPAWWAREKSKPSGLGIFDLRKRTDAERVEQLMSNHEWAKSKSLEEVATMYIDLAETLQMHEQRLRRLEGDDGERLGT